MKKIFFAALALFTVNCSLLTAQDLRLTSAPFTRGELLRFNVQYRAALIPPIGMMSVTMRTLAENIGGVPHFHAIGTGKTTGAAKSMFPVNDTYHTWVDSASLLPSRMTSDIVEGNYRLKATYNYDWRNRTVTSQVRKSDWPADRFTQMPLSDLWSADPFSLIYRLRAIDMSTVVEGRKYPLGLVLRQVEKPIYFVFHGRETLNLKKLGKRPALRFTCTMATSDGSTYEEGMELTVWVSDDERRLPLLIECPIRVGRVTVTLTNF